jgi:hypothetical protein
VTAGAITRRQREVLDELSEHAAFSYDTARGVSGIDSGVAETLAKRGVLNKRYNEHYGAAYWIRREGEAATGTSIDAGFIVLLTRDLPTPSGRSENFFLARARYDGRGPTFRRLLRGWMEKLGLKNKDLLGGTWGFELITADAPVFGGDHVIIDETAP